MITVNEFLKNFCTRVKVNETSSYVELMMDDHKCIEYGGTQYYIPENGILHEHEFMYDFLVDNYIL